MAQARMGGTLVLFVLALVCNGSMAFASGTYTATRFDVYATVVDGGMDVRETVQFDFQSGTFVKVWRDIPASRTDGIDVLDAFIDGVAVAPLVTRGSSVHVEWRFPATGPSSHTFTLHYRVRGLVYRELDRDVVRWRALPSEHSYRIDASRIVIHAAEPDADPPKAEAHRAVLDYARAIPAGGIDIQAGPIQSNGYIVADVRFPPGRLATVQPNWRRRQDAAMALAPRWAMTGTALFLIGIVGLVFARSGYASPSIRMDEATAAEPPSPLPAAMAAALANNGRFLGHVAPATLIDLADRGVLAIRELPRRLGVRTFEIEQVPGTYQLDEHETVAVTSAFGGSGDPVTLGRARGRLARAGRRFRAALNADLTARGFLDVDRKGARDRVTATGFVFLLIGVLGSTAAALFVPAFGGWIFLVPAGAGIAGITGVIVAASMTPLSDDALVEAARWRGYRRYLKSIAANRDETPASIPSRAIVYGVALGLAYHWARFLRRHPDAAPTWFVALDGDGAGFAAFIGAHAAGSAGASGAGAAGGGASGAA
jgi:Predicted membrane protein (DUF2207)